MKLVRYAANDSTHVGILEGSEVLQTDFADLLDLIGAGADERTLRAQASRTPLSDVRILAPIAAPGKILFCGINYRSHKEEAPNAVLPSEPFFFSKLPSAVIGPGEAVVCPTPKTQLDYEVELAIVIGRGAKLVRRENALDHVFGYTVVNDVSARDVQFKDNQITLGKGFDTFCPMGPAIVTADQIPDPQQLRLSTRVNGETRQSASTDEQLFPLAFLIEWLSRYVTLRPGDVVSTGTPAGVGLFRQPPTFLQPGDEVEVEVDAVGVLRNPIVAGW